jgi:guanyl-specific ribonuclease Sa
MNEGMSAMGSDTRQGIDMAVSIINSLISGDMTGAAAGALAPKIATIIKQQTEGNTVANTVSHAILGAVVAELQGNSALVGGLGAAASERGAEVIMGILYPGKTVAELSQEERQQISALSQLATGLAIAAAGGDIQDINTGVAAGKNAVENNNLARAAWYLVRPSEIGAPVSINAVDVLMAEGLTAAESKAFLESLNLEQRRLIEIALVDSMGDGFLEDAVLKTYERYYNDYLKEKDGKKGNDNTLAGTGSSSAGGAPGLPPDDKNNNKSNSTERIKEKKLDELPNNVRDTFSQYEKNGWNGNFNGQTPGTNAGRIFKNSDNKLPKVDSNGNPITYREFDVNNKIQGQARDAERFVQGSNGSVYYTNNHYQTFIKVTK